jgi:hypothetical protein
VNSSGRVSGKGQREIEIDILKAMVHPHWMPGFRKALNYFFKPERS